MEDHLKPPTPASDDALEGYKMEYAPRPGWSVLGGTYAYSFEPDRDRIISSYEALKYHGRKMAERALAQELLAHSLVSSMPELPDSSTWEQIEDTIRAAAVEFPEDDFNRLERLREKYPELGENTPVLKYLAAMVSELEVVISDDVAAEAHRHRVPTESIKVRVTASGVRRVATGMACILYREELKTAATDPGVVE